MKWLSVIRDLISMAVGAFGLIHSQITGQSSTELLIVYTALLGYPGLFQIIELKKKGGSDSSNGGS